MTLIVCLDEENGMLFLGRRQSMDRCVRERILELSRCSILWMNAYSAKQFDELPGHVRISENPCEEMGEQDFCFAENIELSKVLQRIEKLIVFRWNRRYPSDRKFPWEFLSPDFRCCLRTDFAGFSHECITQEVYGS
jgi:hypothetical protein